MALRFRRGPVAADDAPRPDPSRMTLIEHLAELRSRLIKSIIALVVGATIGFFLYAPILHFLIHPYTVVTHRTTLLVTDPLEAFSIRMKLSLYVGLMISSPVVLWQLWRFITPGLNPNEKRYAIPFITSSMALFGMGAVLAYATYEQTLKFFSAFGGSSLNYYYSPGKYLGLLVIMMFIFGLGFEFPVVLVFLQVANVLHWRRLAGWRRYAIVLIFVVDAIITPSGDPITLCAMAIPMCLFYEAAILIGRFVLKKK